MSIPTNTDVLTLLDRLDSATADDLESQWLDFKPWKSSKEDMKVAVEYAVCFANSQGGVVVFGVADRTRGRAAAIHGADGYDIDVWVRGIFDSTRPNIAVHVEELEIPEGTGKLLVVRVPKGIAPPYGTAQGTFKQRVGKNCMPMDPQGFARSQISMGAVDWSGLPAEGVELDALDPLQIHRARNILQRYRPQSDLLTLDDAQLLACVNATREGRVTRAGLLLFGKEEVLSRLCPQHQVHFVHQVSETRVARNDSFRRGLLEIVERIEQLFQSSTNPEQEVSIGLFRLRIPAFDLDVVREAVLNAVTHRDYTNPNEVLVRQSPSELVITSPGGFLGDITPRNILRHEPLARNRTLAESFEKLGLVERAGLGRRRIFIPTLSYGKRVPRYETDGQRVILRIFDGTFDERMAVLIAKWRGEGRDLTLDSLLVLNYLTEHAFLDVISAAELLQVSRQEARGILDQLANPKTGILERKGQTRAATFHLTKAVAKDLIGRAGYTRLKGIDPIRYREWVREFVDDHGSITPRECRELLGLGDSASAKVEISRYLRQWSSSDGFLTRSGSGPSTRYFLRGQTDET